MGRREVSNILDGFTLVAPSWVIQRLRPYHAAIIAKDGVISFKDASCLCHLWSELFFFWKVCKKHQKAKGLEIMGLKLRSLDGEMMFSFS